MNPSNKLMNKNLLLVLQGQFVSILGDCIYIIAIGFFVLELTESTAAMGLIMALSALPKVFLSPFIGVIIDRSNRKTVLILSDLAGGLIILVLAVLAYHELLSLWLLAVGALLLGVSQCFFQPTVSAMLPDLTEPTKLMKVNATFQMSLSVSGMIGSAVGGFLYSLMGMVPIFFLNSATFLFSAVSEMFLKVPDHRKPGPPVHFFEDMKSGFRFMLGIRGLVVIMGFAVCVNFFSQMGMTAMLPFFKNTEGLGPEKFGILMALMGFGLFAGSLIMRFLKIQPHQQHRYFLGSTVISLASFALLPLFISPWVIFLLMVPATLCMTIANTLSITVRQLSIPSEKRGKVLAFSRSLVSASVPLAMGVSGVLAEYIQPRLLITVSFLCPLLFLPLLLHGKVRDFLNLKNMVPPVPRTENADPPQ